MPASLTLNTAALAAVEDLSLLARTVVEGFFDGLHRSPFLGYSTEFSAYRAYARGDELRHVDWKLWGRTDKLYVKQFEDDTNLQCHLLLDTSESMNFGEGNANKFDYGRLLAAVLAYLMTRQHDAPGLVLFGETTQCVPAQARRHQADELFTLLTQQPSQGRTVLGQDLFEAVESLTRAGLSVVISDFFTSDDQGLQLLQQLRARRQEVILFHLLAPEEWEFPYDGNCIMQDCESGEQLPVQAEAMRKDYRQRIREFCSRLEQECVRLEIDYVRLLTHEPLDVALIAYLEKRNAL